MRLEGSIDFSNQEFSVNSSTVPYKIAITGQIKKRSSVLRTRKIRADDDGWEKPLNPAISRFYWVFRIVQLFECGGIWYDMSGVVRFSNVVRHPVF